MIALLKAEHGPLLHLEWNPHSDPPGWEIVGTVCCCDCKCGCCDAMHPTEIIVTFDTKPVQCDEFDRLRREEGGGTVDVTPVD